MDDMTHWRELNSVLFQKGGLLLNAEECEKHFELKLLLILYCHQFGAAWKVQSYSVRLIACNQYGYEQ